MIEFLLRYDVDVNARTIDGRTPLYEAISATDEESKGTGKIATVQALLGHGANPSIPDLSGRTVLHWASYYGHDKIVKMLLMTHVNVNIKDDENVTPLHLACMCGNVEIVQLLVENGADISAMDKYLRTPMHYAARTASSGIVKYLLENKANPDAADDAGDTPVMLIEGPNSNDLQEIMQRHSDQSRQRIRSRNQSVASMHI